MTAAILSAALVLAGATPACRSAGSALESGTPAGDATIRREIEAVNGAMVAAFNRGDYLGAARFYADDAQIIGPGGLRVTGRAAVDRYWTSIPTGSTWKLDVLEVGGGRASPWQLGRSTLVIPSRGGEVTTSTSIVDFIAIWRRQSDGSLKLYIDMYVPTPRPAAGR